MEASKPFNPLMSGTQVKMIGIGKNDACIQGFQVFIRHCFDGGGGSHRHEHRRRHVSVRRMQYAPSRHGSGLFMQDFESKLAGSRHR
jgi:hypothetical protein